jgi:hypothetical protein
MRMRHEIYGNAVYPRQCAIGQTVAQVSRANHVDNPPKSGVEGIVGMGNLQVMKYFFTHKPHLSLVVGAMDVRNSKVAHEMKLGIFQTRVTHLRGEVIRL